MPWSKLLMWAIVERIPVKGLMTIRPTPSRLWTMARIMVSALITVLRVPRNVAPSRTGKSTAPKVAHPGKKAFCASRQTKFGKNLLEPFFWGGGGGVRDVCHWKNFGLGIVYLFCRNRSLKMCPSAKHSCLLKRCNLIQE